MAHIVKSARASGIAGYPGDGSTRWTTCHVRRALDAVLMSQVADTAELIRLTLEHAPSGSVLHAAAAEGTTQLEIASAIGQHYKLPVQSVPADKTAEHFGFMVRCSPTLELTSQAHFVTLDAPASSKITRQITGWQPTHPTLLDDILAGVYDDASEA